MSAFMNRTISDIRGGRDSWRVLAIFSMLSFAISIAAVAVRHPF